MTSKYFELTTKSEIFKKETCDLIKSLKGQKVILYGAGEGFFALNKVYNFDKALNIIAIADKKFETSSKDITGLRQIEPKQILNEDFDKIIVTNEQPRGVMNYLVNNLEIEEGRIVKIFNEEFKEEALNVNYLYKHKFDKNLPKLIKKLKGKSVVLYGAGIYFETILKYFDLSGLNIIGISDKRFEGHKEDETFKGYKVYGPDEIIDIKPDYVLVATKFYISIVENLYYEQFRGTNIKIRPLVKKTLLTLLQEIWT